MTDINEDEKTVKILQNSNQKEYAPKNNIEENKAQISLLPLDLLSEMLVPAYMEGLKKYQRESWRKGFKASTMMDACMRHLTAFYYEHEDYDSETFKTYGIRKHHLGAALFCIISLYNSVRNDTTLDDRPT